MCSGKLTSPFALWTWRKGLMGRYTAANDVSSRIPQWATSQWDFSKSFDGSCPIGPAIVHKSAVGDYRKLGIKGIYNGKTVQDGQLEWVFLALEGRELRVAI